MVSSSPKFIGDKVIPSYIGNLTNLNTLFLFVNDFYLLLIIIIYLEILIEMN